MLSARAIISAASAAAWSGKSLVDNSFSQQGDVIVLNNSLTTAAQVAGLDADQQKGQSRRLVNRGATPIVLKQEDSAANAEDRFATPDVTIPGYGMVLAIYNGTRWEAFGNATAADVSPSILPDYALNGAMLKRYDLRAIGAGSVPILTCPAGKKILLMKGVTGNGTGGNISAAPYFNRGGTAARTNSTSTVGTLSSTAALPGQLICMEPTDILSFLTGGAGLSVFGHYLEFPDLTSGWKTAVLYAFINGQNTVYEVPAGKRAYVASISNATGFVFFGLGNLQYTNDSGAARTIAVYYVPTGQVFDATKHVLTSSAPTVANAAQIRADSLPNIMEAGDKIIVTSDSNAAGQFAGMTVFEAPV